MAIRIQIRRDTAANWTSANPVLRAGEFGVETDTLKFKIGNGTSTWTQITSYANVTPTGLSNSLGDYILSADQGNAGGPAELDSNGDLIIPENSIILWNDADYDYTTTLTATQPTADRTITFPNNSGTVITTGNLHNITEFGVLVSPIVMEGSTANDFELTISAGDPTADRTITFPDVTGTVVTTGDAATVTNTMLAGSIANDKLTNSAITINGTSTSLGGSRTLGTDDVSEGSTNKYFTDERAQDAIATAIAAGTHTNITITYDDDNNKFTFVGANTYSDENAQDAVGNAVGNGLDYNDETGAISVDPSEFALSAVGAPTANVAMATYKITGLGAPTESADAATKQYVDNTASGIVAKPQVLGATTANIDATYNNGTAGVGATLTHNTNGVFPSSSGGATGWSVGKGILVKNQTNKAQNGRYFVSDMGSVSTPYVLTRCSFCDEASEIPGAYIYVQAGTNAGTGWIQVVADPATFVVGTDDINVYQFSGSGTYTAGTGLTLTGNEYSINTSVTADLSTAQTLTNKTINANANTITVTSANVSDFNEAAQDAVGNNVGSGLAYTDSTGAIGINYVTLGDTLLDGVSGASYGLIGTSTYLDVKTGNGYNKEIELDIAAVKTQLNTDGYLTTSSTSTLTNKTLTSPKINEDVALTATATELNYVDGVTSAIQTQLDGKVDESLFDTKGDILVASADNTPVKLAAGTNGYLLTANSSAANGIEWAAAPVSLPSQSGESGKYLTTDGTTASWGTLVVPITTGTSTVSANTATTIDTTALSAFTSIEYMVSLKQGSKIRTSKVVVQTDGTSVDMTEFAITETGGTIAGVVVSVAVSSTNAVLQLTATDAVTTNVTVKFSKVAL
jgi:hypothetical protein